MMTVDGAEIGFADMLTQAVMSQSAKTHSEWMSDRIKSGVRAARERRKVAADAAGAGSSSE